MYICTYSYRTYSTSSLLKLHLQLHIYGLTFEEKGTGGKGALIKVHVRSAVKNQKTDTAVVCMQSEHVLSHNFNYINQSVTTSDVLDYELCIMFFIKAVLSGRHKNS